MTNPCEQKNVFDYLLSRINDCDCECDHVYDVPYYAQVKLVKWVNYSGTTRQSKI